MGEADPPDHDLEHHSPGPHGGALLGPDAVGRLVEGLDSPVGIAGPDGVVAYVNAVGARMLGGTQAQIVGRHVRDLFPDQAATLLLARIEAALRTGEGDSVESLVPIAGQVRWHRTSVQPIRDADGRPALALVTATDIHDLSVAREELRALNQTLEARVRQRTAEVQDLYDRAPVGYHSLDADGCVTQVNETELRWLGYTREEMVGRPFTDFLTPESRRTFHASFPIFKQRGEASDVELTLVRRDGSALAVILSATAVYDAAGRYLMSRATVTDMTARRTAEETLRRANIELAQAARAKDEFLSTVSHELRTPLHNILALSEMLAEQTRGELNERQLRSVRGIEESGRHLLALINDILDVSKIDAGRFELQTEDVAVEEACRAALALIQEPALRKGLTLDFEMTVASMTIAADPRRLKQMLANLLSNAVKFTPAGGLVTLAVTPLPAEGRLEIAVRDTGVGIAADDLPRLFQPFSQLDEGQARQREGTGLGLALVRRLAELHGGSVAVASEPGVGSTFTVILPMHGAAPGEPPGPGEDSGVADDAAQAPGPAPRRRWGALVVDDSEMNLDVICDYLEECGFATRRATSAEEGLAAAADEAPDIILMDIQMPEMDGLEAIRRLRATPETAATPVIALTALAMAGDRERGLAAGASEYVTKPVSLRQLRAIMERLLEPRGAGG